MEQSVAYRSPPSLSGRFWTDRSADAATVTEVATACDLSPIAARCLVLRGWSEPATAYRALHPSIEDLHDPFQMNGMDKALSRIQRAVANQERIRIVTDYDVDGTTSSLILQAALHLIGVERSRIDYHIPDRFRDGYGFSPGSAQAAIDAHIDLIITADVGVRAHESVTLAASGGVDVIICDHHLPEGENVPTDALAVLCPPQQGCSYPNPALAACGVSLKLAQALLHDPPKRDPLIRSLMKLAAIGTVADVVDLATPENRAIVTLGLEAVSEGPNNAGLKALLEISGCAGRTVTAQDCGYRIGPRINAAGRIEHAGLAVDLLQEHDRERAMALATHIDQLNQERRVLQDRLVRRAIASLEDGPTPAFPLLGGRVADGWHKGVTGIVAGRVRDSVHRPVAIYTLDTNGLATGSVRSTPAVHAVEALNYAKDILIRFGGHPVAAGFTVEAAHLDTLQTRLSEFATSRSDDDGPLSTYDAVVPVGELNLALAERIQRLGPYGKGNPPPVFRVPEVRPAAVRMLKDKHLRIELTPGVSAIWWGAAEHYGAFDGGALDLYGRLEVNHWRGRTSAQLVVEDVVREANA